MAIMETNVDEMISMVDASVKQHLVELIKAKLMVHAEQVVEETAKNIAEELVTRIEHYRHPDGELKINIFVGPKDKQTHIEREVNYTVKQG